MGLHFRFAAQPRNKAYYLDHYYNRVRHPYKFQRRVILVMIPFGLWFTLGGLAMMLTPSLGQPWTDALTALSGMSMIAMVVLAYWAPDWLKPEWLREEERRRGRG